MSVRPSDARAARAQLVEALELDLVGPWNDHACARELLKESPYKWYLTGYLMPGDAPESQRYDATSPDEIDSATANSPGDDDQPVDRLAAPKSFLPSSMGLTILVPAEVTELKVKVEWGDYAWEGEEVELADAPEVWEEEEGDPEEESSARVQEVENGCQMVLARGSDGELSCIHLE